LADLAFPRFVEEARQMALGHVGNFVGQHRGQFRFRLGGENQPRMHADVAAGHGEGIEGRVAQREKLELLPQFGTARRKPVAEPVEEAGDFGIVEIGGIAADFEHDRFADAPFHRRR
jgi:hypothetical protein